MTNQDKNYSFPASLNKVMSRKIQLELSKGNVINKENYNHGISEMEHSELYTALFNDLPFFQELYSTIGWDLVFRPEGEFFHVSKLDTQETDEVDNSSLKICIPLYFIAEHMIRQGFDSATLWSDSLGVTPEDMAALIENDHAVSCIAASGHKSLGDAVKTLKSRGIVFENTNGNIVFSGAAKYFVNKIIDQFAT